jgi:hypothetical protein
MVRNAMKIRKNRPLLFLDLAVPRDVEPQVAKLPNVFVHDLDALGGLVAQSLAHRRAEVPKVEAIIDSEMARFLRWHRSLALKPTVTAFRSHFEEIAKEELDRHRGRFRPEDHAALEALVHGIVQKSSTARHWAQPSGRRGGRDRTMTRCGIFRNRSGGPGADRPAVAPALAQSGHVQLLPRGDAANALTVIETTETGPARVPAPDRRQVSSRRIDLALVEGRIDRGPLAQDRRPGRSPASVGALAHGSWDALVSRGVGLGAPRARSSERHPVPPFAARAPAGSVGRVRGNAPRASRVLSGTVDAIVTPPRDSTAYMEVNQRHRRVAMLPAPVRIVAIRSGWTTEATRGRSVDHDPDAEAEAKAGGRSSALGGGCLVPSARATARQGARALGLRRPSRRAPSIRESLEGGPAARRAGPAGPGSRRPGGARILTRCEATGSPVSALLLVTRMDPRDRIVEAAEACRSASLASRFATEPGRDPRDSSVAGAPTGGNGHRLDQPSRRSSAAGVALPAQDVLARVPPFAVGAEARRRSYRHLDVDYVAGIGGASLRRIVETRGTRGIRRVAFCGRLVAPRSPRARPAGIEVGRSRSRHHVPEPFSTSTWCAPRSRPAIRSSSSTAAPVGDRALDGSPWTRLEALRVPVH